MPVKTVVFRMSGNVRRKEIIWAAWVRILVHLNGRDLCRKGVFDEMQKRLLTGLYIFVCLFSSCIRDQYICCTEDHGQRRFYVSVSAQQGSADDG